MSVNDWIKSKSTMFGIVSGILAFLLLAVDTMKDGIQASDLPVILGGFAVLMGLLGLKAVHDEVGAIKK